MTALTAHPRMLFSAVAILQHTHTIFPAHKEDTLSLSSTTRGLQHLAPDRVRAAECADTLQSRRGGPWRMFTAPVGVGIIAAVFLHLSVFLLLPPNSSSSDRI